MQSIRVDGHDILAVLSATQAARKYVMTHQKPILIEAMAYRLGAHSSSDDPSGYRDKAEEEKWQQEDPVGRFERFMLQQEGSQQQKLRHNVKPSSKIF